MELDRLKIDRRQVRTGAPRRGGLPWIRLSLLALGLAAAWWFRAPLLRVLEDARLPKVEVAVAYRPDPRAAGASGGTAANGYVVARKRAALSADTPGRIVELFVEEGTQVETGDLVARLFSEELEASVAAATAELAAARESVAAAAARVAAAEARLPSLNAQVGAAEAAAARASSDIDAAVAAQRLAEAEHARARDLLEEGFDTQERLDRAVAELERTSASAASARAALTSAQAQVDVARAALTEQEAEIASSRAVQVESQARVPVAQANLARAEATLSKTEVRAPFAGVIVLKDAEVGEVVSPNSQGASSRGSVATLVDPTTLEVQVELPETSISRVEIGAPARVFLDAYTEDPLPGRVDRIWPTANRQKATIEVRVVFLEADPRLRPEMGARVVFDQGAEAAAAADAPRGILVPAEALVEQGGERGLFVLARDSVEWRRPVVGERRGASIEIEDGLDDGERVVVAPPVDLRDGDRVKVAQ